MTDVAGWRNPAVELGQLPAVDGAPFEPLEPAYLRQQRVIWAMVIGVLVAAGIVILVLSSAATWVWPIVIVPLVVILASAWVLEGMAFRHRGVQLRERDVSTRRGLIGRKTISVPFTRVQHVTVERGLLDRIFGLSTVVIFTAGAIAADARVSGLEPERADRLREGIINRSNLETAAATAGEPDETEAVETGVAKAVVDDGEASGDVTR